MAWFPRPLFPTTFLSGPDACPGSNAKNSVSPKKKGLPTAAQHTWLRLPAPYRQTCPSLIKLGAVEIYCGTSSSTPARAHCLTRPVGWHLETTRHAQCRPFAACGDHYCSKLSQERISDHKLLQDILTVERRIHLPQIPKHFIILLQHVSSSIASFTVWPPSEERSDSAHSRMHEGQTNHH